MPLRNLLHPLPHAQAEEVVDTLLARKGVRLERIVSHGHSTPPGEWYDQEWDEWVLVLQGRADLVIEGQAPRRVHTGDALLLPAHQRHRVAWTDPDGPTVWLCVFVPPEED